MLSVFDFKSNLFEATIDKKTGNLSAKIRCADGSWIKSMPYPNDPVGITACLDLAINVHTGKFGFEGIEKGEADSVKKIENKKKRGRISNDK